MSILRATRQNVSRHFRVILRVFTTAVLLISCACTFLYAAGWSTYQAVIWQDKTAVQYIGLQKLGVTAAKVQINREGETPLTARRKVANISGAGLRPYIENIGTDFFSPYHRWMPGRPINEAFIAAKKLLSSKPQSKLAFVRVPSLSDRREQLRLQVRIRRAVESFSFARPLYFDLGDETGIADLSSAWDFDFGPASLRGLRGWLKQQYITLPALNNEWGTHFSRWQEVVPPTTSETMRRKDSNYSSWSDFKAWMDVAFSRALKADTLAMHGEAPWALSGIEGAQIPGWGGYDYSLLAKSVDVMEIYDADSSLDIATSFNPNLVILTTADADDPAFVHNSWYEFLRGARGLILWDEKDALIRRDGTMGRGAESARSLFSAMNGAPARAIAKSKAHRDPIAIVYSPASFRIQWMLDHKVLGDKWTERRAQDETEDSPVRASRRYVSQLLMEMGFAPRFVSDQEIAKNVLSNHHYRALIMPQVLALSTNAALKITAFTKQGGILIIYGSTATFDEHGLRLKRSRMSALPQSVGSDILSLSGTPRKDISALGRQFANIGLLPLARVTDANGLTNSDVKQFIFDRGCASTVALLGDTNARGLRSSYKIKLTLKRSADIIDLNKGISLGKLRVVSVSVGSDSPQVFSWRTTHCKSKVSLP